MGKIAMTDIKMDNVESSTYISALPPLPPGQTWSEKTLKPLLMDAPAFARMKSKSRHYKMQKILGKLVKDGVQKKRPAKLSPKLKKIQQALTARLALLASRGLMSEF